MTSLINASTSAGVVITPDTSGVLALQTAGTTAVSISSGQVATFAQAPVLPAASIPQAALAAGVAGNGPAFSYYASGATSVANSTFTKILFAASEFDTASAVSSSRFTPTVAGYYQINACVTYGNNSSAEKVCAVFKNGATYKIGQDFTASIYGTTVSCIVYLNGSTDYVEIYGYQTSGGAINTNAIQVQTYFQGFLARAA